MFERLVKNNYPYTLLMRQSRMHPDLVKLFSYHYSEQRKEAGQIKSSQVHVQDDLVQHMTLALMFMFINDNYNLPLLYSGSMTINSLPAWLRQFSGGPTLINMKRSMDHLSLTSMKHKWLLHCACGY